jgi:hypothetical protein
MGFILRLKGAFEAGVRGGWGGALLLIQSTLEISLQKN